ncbi:MAG: Hsp33 family molecular chaperone HslO [Lachnospiraceae bacterium]|nr:Hsp33 family molecular chaperone HslO [Lachnospiraceae bacterium]
MDKKTDDYIVRATAANGQIRAFAATTRNLVEEARAAHNTSPVVTAALGRMLTAGAMMGAMMKGRDDLLTLQMRGNGPMKGITVTAGSPDEETGMVSVKGYALVPDVIMPARVYPETNGQKRKLNVGGAIGIGVLSVIKDMGLKDPYIGQVTLKTGEIAEDLTYYFATSEQVPSSVGLGVLMEKDNTVKQAGGFIIQLMPFADDAVIARLEERLGGMPSVTTLLDEGRSPEEILEYVLGDIDRINDGNTITPEARNMTGKEAGSGLDINDTLPVRFFCNCDKSRVEKALISIGRKELDEIIKDGKDIELKCHFCNKAYNFTLDEVKKIRARL